MKRGGKNQGTHSLTFFLWLSVLQCVSGNTAPRTDPASNITTTTTSPETWISVLCWCDVECQNPLPPSTPLHPQPGAWQLGEASQTRRRQALYPGLINNLTDSEEQCVCVCVCVCLRVIEKDVCTLGFCARNPANHLEKPDLVIGSNNKLTSIKLLRYQ